MPVGQFFADARHAHMETQHLLLVLEYYRERLLSKFLTLPPSERSAQVYFSATSSLLGFLLSTQLLPTSSTAFDAEVVALVINELKKHASHLTSTTRLSLVTEYAKEVEKGQRGQLLLPGNAPWQLVLALVARLLEITVVIRNISSELPTDFIECCLIQANELVESSKPTKVLYGSRQSETQWILALIDVYRLLITPMSAGTEAEREMALEQCKKRLVEAVGATMRQPLEPGRKHAMSFVEEPNSALVGALCEYLGQGQQARWWYTKFLAECSEQFVSSVQPATSELIQELSAYLQPDSSLWKTNARSQRTIGALLLYLAQSTLKNAELQDKEERQRRELKSSLIGSNFGNSPFQLGSDGTRSQLIPISDGSRFLQHTPAKQSIEIGKPAPLSPFASNLQSSFPQILTTDVPHFFSTTRPKEEPSSPSVIPLKIGTGPVTSHPIVPAPTEDQPKIKVEIEEKKEAAKMDVDKPVTGATEETSETKEERLARRVEAFGCRTVEVPLDGNCQFSSLAHLVYKKMTYAPVVRKQVTDWLAAHENITLKNGSKLSDFVLKPWAEYVHALTRDGEWGDHVTLLAAAEAFQTKITIIDSIPDETNCVVTIVPSIDHPEADPDTLPTLLLAHLSEYHYFPLIDPNHNSEQLQVNAQ